MYNDADIEMIGLAESANAAAAASGKGTPYSDEMEKSLYSAIYWANWNMTGVYDAVTMWCEDNEVDRATVDDGLVFDLSQRSIRRIEIEEGDQS